MPYAHRATQMIAVMIHRTVTMARHLPRRCSEARDFDARTGGVRLAQGPPSPPGRGPPRSRAGGPHVKGPVGAGASATGNVDLGGSHPLLVHWPTLIGPLGRWPQRWRLAQLTMAAQ